MVTIGKNILENLTTGMYSDSKIIYREYIQNACDQIDKAVRTGLTAPSEAEIEIFIEASERCIRIEDNATGVSKDLFASQLGDIANSDKKLGQDKGFRGIGRLCGLAYCSTLVFTTSCKGEAVKSIMQFDAKKMRAMLASDKKYSVEEIIDEIMTTKAESESSDIHYFRVELFDINEENRDLLDDDKVREYLSFVAPVPYANKFIFRDDIYKHAKSIGYKIDEYRISVNGAELFKEYRKWLYEGNDSSPKPYDEINEIEFKDIYDENGDLIVWMWYGLSRFEKAIPKAQNPMYGFRLRQGNIQIGDNTVVADLFKEGRGNSYYVGEIFAVDKRLIPNSQRDYFNENEQRVYFEDKLRSFFHEELHTLYHTANRYKNSVEHVNKYNAAVDKWNEKTQKGFINESEKNNYINAVSSAKKKRDEALHYLSRNVLPSDPTATLTPEQKVIKIIKEDYDRDRVLDRTKEAEKKAQDLTAAKRTNKASKSDYFAQKFSTLNKKERKLLGDIMAIVAKYAPENIAAQIQSEIERTFK